VGNRKARSGQLVVRLWNYKWMVPTVQHYNMGRLITDDLWGPLKVLIRTP